MLKFSCHQIAKIKTTTATLAAHARRGLKTHQEMGLTVANACRVDWLSLPHMHPIHVVVLPCFYFLCRSKSFHVHTYIYMISYS